MTAIFANLAVQLFALVLLAVHYRAASGFARFAPRGVVALAACTLALPLVQLVPLPEQLWGALPGRALLDQSLDLAGGARWYPTSLAPAATVIALTGLIAPATLLVLAMGLPPAKLVALQRLLVALGVGIALFGTLHLFDERWGDLYAGDQPMPGIILGTFVDRNATGLFFDICLLLLVALPGAPRSPLETAWRWGAGGFLALCVILTGSRTAMALLAAPVLLLGWRAVSGRGRFGAALWLGGLLAAAALTFGVLASTGRVQASFERFDGDDGMRAEMREDAAFAARRYWPVGAGMGSFDDVFQIDESLEYVSQREAGRAHMDYLELAIEAGLAGLVLAAAWLGWVLAGGWRALRNSDAWPARAAVFSVMAIAAQSLLSFPLRNQAMLCVAAFAVVLIARSPGAGARKEDPA